LSFDIKTNGLNAIGCAGKYMKPVKQVFLEEPVIVLYIQQRSCDTHVGGVELERAVDIMEKHTKIRFKARDV
jgi:hypothetical protein